MFKTSVRTNYTKKNSTHIYTKESEMKLSRGEKYILIIQTRFNEENNNLKEYIYKERSILGIRRILRAKSQNKLFWNVELSDANSTIRNCQENYEKFNEYMFDTPNYYSLEDNKNIIVSNFTQQKLKKIFNLDGNDEFFYIQGNEPLLSNEGNTGENLGYCFENNYYD